MVIIITDFRCKHITHDILTPKTHLGGVHPFVKHRGVTQGVGAAVVQTPGEAEHLGTDSKWVVMIIPG